MSRVVRTCMSVRPEDVIELLDSSEESGVPRGRGKQTFGGRVAIELSDSSEESGRGRGRDQKPNIDLDLRLGFSCGGGDPASSSKAGERQPGSKSLDKAVLDLLHLFPLLCPKVAATLLYPLMEHTDSSTAVQQATDYILEHGIHETAFVDTTQGTPWTGGCHSDSEKGDKPEARNLKASVGAYEQQCLDHLAAEFPRVKRPDLRDAWNTHGSRLGPTYRAIQAEYEKAVSEDGSKVKSNGPLNRVHWLPNGRLNLLRNARAITRTASRERCPEFTVEWAALQLELTEEAGQEGGDEGIDQGQLDAEEGSQPDSQGIECGCCCCDFPFEEMVQCADGHLFCFGCLRRRVEESIFGGLQACGSLPCMDTNGCTESFPFSEIKRALPGDVLSKYEQRQAEDAVARAKLQGLVYCPFCNLPWEVESDMEVLNCPNESCGKASCLLCKEPNHLPLRCHEVEKKTETSQRRQIEELMSKAVIRVCSICKAELVKSEGCNKVMCRCGQAMCYVCRKPIKANYEHFCQHAREPNKRCAACSKCGLWEQEEDDKVVNEAKEAALKQIAQVEPGILKRAIGPSEMEVANKLPRLQSWHPGVFEAHQHARARWARHNFVRPAAVGVAEGPFGGHVVQRVIAPIMGHIPVPGALANNRPMVENIRPGTLRDPLGRPLGQHHAQLGREVVNAPQEGQVPHVFRFGAGQMREVDIGWR